MTVTAFVGGRTGMALCGNCAVGGCDLVEVEWFVCEICGQEISDG